MGDISARLTPDGPKNWKLYKNEGKVEIEGKKYDIEVKIGGKWHKVRDLTGSDQDKSDLSNAIYELLEQSKEKVPWGKFEHLGMTISLSDKKVTLVPRGGEKDIEKTAKDVDETVSKQFFENIGNLPWFKPPVDTGAATTPLEQPTPTEQPTSQQSLVQRGLGAVKDAVMGAAKGVVNSVMVSNEQAKKAEADRAREKEDILRRLEEIQADNTFTDEIKAEAAAILRDADKKGVDPTNFSPGLVEHITPYRTMPSATPDPEAKPILTKEAKKAKKTLLDEDRRRWVQGRIKHYSDKMQLSSWLTNDVPKKLRRKKQRWDEVEILKLYRDLPGEDNKDYRLDLTRGLLKNNQADLLAQICSQVDEATNKRIYQAAHDFFSSDDVALQWGATSFFNSLKSRGALNEKLLFPISPQFRSSRLESGEYSDESLDSFLEKAPLMEALMTFSQVKEADKEKVAKKIAELLELGDKEVTPDYEGKVNNWVQKIKTSSSKESLVYNVMEALNAAKVKGDPEKKRADYFIKKLVQGMTMEQFGFYHEQRSQKPGQQRNLVDLRGEENAKEDLENYKRLKECEGIDQELQAYYKTPKGQLEKATKLINPAALAKGEGEKFSLTIDKNDAEGLGIKVQSDRKFGLRGQWRVFKHILGKVEVAEKQETKVLGFATLESLRTQGWSSKFIKYNPVMRWRFNRLYNRLMRVAVNDLIASSQANYRELDKEELKKFARSEVTEKLSVIPARQLRISDEVHTSILFDAVDLQTRAAAYGRYIDMAHRVFQRGDIQTAVDINTALQSQSLKRLEDVQERLTSSQKSKLERLQRDLSSDRNYESFRTAVRKGKRRVSVPFMGVYQTDITFAHDALGNLQRKVALVQEYQRASEAERPGAEKKLNKAVLERLNKKIDDLKRTADADGQIGVLEGQRQSLENGNMSLEIKETILQEPVEKQQATLDRIMDEALGQQAALSGDRSISSQFVKDLAAENIYEGIAKAGDVHELRKIMIAELGEGQWNQLAKAANTKVESLRAQPGAPLEEVLRLKVQKKDAQNAVEKMKRDRFYAQSLAIQKRRSIPSGGTS